PFHLLSDHYHFLRVRFFVSLFFFTDPATTEIYTLSLHDALPICLSAWSTSRTYWRLKSRMRELISRTSFTERRGEFSNISRTFRSEEHTSELQSQSNLVCRLLLEKKKNYRTTSRERRLGAAPTPK